MINAESKYGRTMEKAYKNTSNYDKKEITMLTIYEVSIKYHTFCVLIIIGIDPYS